MNDATAAARVLVVDRSRELTMALRYAQEPDDRTEIVHLSQPTQVLDTMARQGPWDAVVAGPSETDDEGLTRLAALRETDPVVGLLATVNGADPSDLRTFLQAQPDELVQLPTDDATLRAALDTALRAAATRRRPDTAETRTRHGRVHVVTGPTGGCGKTTVAVNLAALHAAAGERVVLIDADLQFGEVTAALQARPTLTAYDALLDEHDRRLPDAELTESLPETLTDTGCGFSLLAAPGDPAAADHISEQDVGTVIDVLRAHADVVVVDTATGLGPTTLAALDHSDHAIAVCEVDVPSVTNLHTFLATLDGLGIDRDRRSILLNKELPDSGVSADDAIKVLGQVSGSLAFTPAVVRSLNNGQPFCAAEPDHPTAVALRHALAPLLLRDGFADGQSDERRRLRDRWRRRVRHTKAPQ